VLRGFRVIFHILIHGLVPTFREHCSSFHQGEKQPDTKLFWRIPYVYSLFSKKKGGGEGAEYKGKGERGGRVIGTVIVVIIF